MVVIALLFALLGFMWGTFLEWALHKYVLHRYATKKKWIFHLAHHRHVIKEGGKDHEYDEPFFTSIPRLKEAGSMVFMAVIHLPFALISPWLWVGMATFAFTFWSVHLASHLWPEWGWRWCPWHMEHHMINASKNYGIVTPLWDWLFGTLITRHRG